MSDDTEITEADDLSGVAPPRKALELVGHEAVWSRLIRQLAADRLPGGVLLHGPRGIGKATAAHLLAQEIFVRTGSESADRVREQIAAGAHPNLFRLRLMPRPTGSGFFTSIRVEDVRDVVASLHKTRGQAGHRVCIVDAAEDCNASAANAMLKVLEEPPPESHFILVSHQPGRLLATIRSRCQAHAMRPLGDESVARIVTQAGFDIPQETISLAEGIPRQALELAGLAETELLTRLRQWLASPKNDGNGAHLKLAHDLGQTRDLATQRFARRMLVNWIAADARNLAGQGQPSQLRLASAGDLWNKASQTLTESETYNLDPTQTFVLLFEMIMAHEAGGTRHVA